MRVLVVGAGAIGTVFARHFQLGGATVGMLVRPRQLEAVQAGTAMYPLHRRASERHTPLRFVPDVTFADQAEALKDEWDLVVLAVSSVALGKGSWLEELVAATECPILAFANGPVAKQNIDPRVPDGRQLWGMLNIISYQAPLPHEELPEPGIAYWFSFGGLGFSGPSSPRDVAIAVLKRGGLPAKPVTSVHAEVAFMSPILSDAVLALECAGWTFDALSADPELLPLAVAAMDESWQLAEKQFGRSRGVAQRLVSPFALRRILGLSGWVLPLDLEAFFGFHYTKIGEQTLANQHATVAELEAAGISADANRELLRRLVQVREGQAAAA